MKSAMNVIQGRHSTKAAKAGSERKQRPRIAPGPDATDAPRRAAPGNGATALTPAQHSRMISAAAYYRAEGQDFPGTLAERDWLEADEQLDDLLAPWGLGRRAP